MAHTKHQAWREFKRAGQIDGMGLVLVVSDEPAANEIADAPPEQPAQFLGMSDDEEPMARYFLPGGL